jgi:hypothetical protein
MSSTVVTPGAATADVVAATGEVDAFAVPMAAGAAVLGAGLVLEATALLVGADCVAEADSVAEDATALLVVLDTAVDPVSVATVVPPQALRSARAPLGRMIAASAWRRETDRRPSALTTMRVLPLISSAPHLGPKRGPMDTSMRPNRLFVNVPDELARRAMHTVWWGERLPHSPATSVR